MQHQVVKNKHFPFFEQLSMKGNIYVALVLRILLIMFLFTVCRIGFYAFNHSFFPGMTIGNFFRLMQGGFVFDLAAVLYINLLFIVLMIVPFRFRHHRHYQTVCQYLFLVTNGIALAANVSDFIYYKFTLRRTTADVFKQFQNEQNLSGLFLRFLYDYWYALLFFVLIMIALIWMYRRIRVEKPQLKNPLAYYISAVVAIPVVALVVIAGVRGGLKHSTRPITLSNAGEYVRDPREISIVLNTPFAILRTVGKTKVQRADYFAAQSLDSIYSPVHIPHDTAAFRKDNVVIIVLESFSKEFFGAFNKDKEQGNYKGYTPFLDSLITHSRTFTYSFANGRKSIDGLPSVVSAIPATSVPYFLSPYGTNRINSLASVLKNKGYHSSFFHGAPNGSMGFQAFMNVAGFDTYYGMSEYGNDADYDGLWGIWDDKFFNYYATTLNSFKEPFVSSIFSVSSHHPFKVPKEYEGQFTGGPLPILKCIQYTDFSLRQFFQKVSRMPWYKRTLFVITADHTSSDIYFDEGRTAWGFYSVPVIFFKPDNSLAGMTDGIAQQTDIMPSVLSYLHNDEPYVAFGRDVLAPDQEPFAFNFKDDVYQLFNSEYLLQFNGEKTVALYNFRTDPLLHNNVMTTQTEVRARMEQKIKGIIQQYNNRMIDNRLTVKPDSVQNNMTPN